MKKIYYLILFIIPFGKSFSQRCISLGCAASQTGIVTDGTIADTLANNLGCYNGNTYKQVYWQFFFAPVADAFTQTYTPTSEGLPLDINYVIFDVGTTAPATFSCPVITTGWTPVTCAIDDHPNQPVGPGLFGISLTTTAGHYYAIAIIIWQGVSTPGDPSYTFNISAPQLGEVNFTTANCPGVLPVTLSSFNATVNNCTVDLEWNAESQSGFKNYEVQSGTDGIKFQTIATIGGTLNGTGQKNSYRDNNPKQGTIYYRLKMTDADGKFEYSKIIALKLNCNRSSIIIYPNPVTDILNISITNLQSNATVARLFDINGRELYSGEIKSGTNMIDMKKFAKGVYMLQLKNNVETQSIKIIK